MFKQQPHGGDESEKFEQLSKEFQDLNNRFSEIRGLIKGLIVGVSILIAVIGLLAKWNLNRVDKIETSRDNIYALLVSELRGKTATAINMLKVTEDSDEQRVRIKELVEFQKELSKINVTGDQFASTGALVEALSLIVQKNDLTTAKKNLELLRSTNIEDTYVKSRVLTLLAAIETSSDIHTTSESLKQLVTEAIQLDGTNALAYNIFGIVNSNLATERLIRNDPEGAKKLMNEAYMGYEMAYELAPSSTGAAKHINNKTWGQLNLVKWYLDRKLPLDEVLTFLKYPEAKYYFAGSRSQLRLYTSLTASAAALETEAQSFLVEAQYNLSVNNRSEAETNKEKALELFLKAFEKGLYKRLKSAKSAKERFRGDFLHTLVKDDPEFMEKIDKGIQRWFDLNPIV